jgi:hypothetical protein
MMAESRMRPVAPVGIIRARTTPSATPTGAIPVSARDIDLSPEVSADPAAPQRIPTDAAGDPLPDVFERLRRARIVGDIDLGDG